MNDGIRTSARPVPTFMKLAVLLIALLPACYTPQIVSPAGAKTLDAWANRSVQRVEVEVEGVKLRGVCSAGVEGAPVVLTLLGSEASITVPQESAGLRFEVFELIAAPRSLGASTLVLDYRGVGASEGECDSLHLVADAWAMWEEALRRAGGNPSRIVIRAMSIGTLAAASLLERGAEPACVVLHAPVRAETVARNWLAHYRSPFVAALVAPFLRQPVDVDLARAIARANTRVIVFASANDELTTRADRELLRAAVRESRGRWIERDLTHLALVSAAYSIGDDELREYARLFPGTTNAWRYPPSCVLPTFRELPDEVLEFVPTDYHLRGGTVIPCGLVFRDLARWRAAARDE